MKLKEVNSLRFDEERKKTGGRLSSCLFISTFNYKVLFCI